MRRQTFLFGISLFLIVGIGAGLFASTRTFHSHVIDPSRPIAEINATDDDGRPFQMSNLRGKVVLLFFGYTHCPDECPLTLAHLKEALALLGTETAQRVQVVMVSTDPAHDTPPVLNHYLNLFNPTFMGITGTPDKMQKIYRDYGVVVLEGGETHSTFVYVIDPTGQLRLTFLPDTLPDDIAHDLRIVLGH